MPVFFNHLSRGRSGTIAGTALASLALAAGALAASGSAATASVAPRECSWHPLALMNGWQSAQGLYGTGDPSYSVTSDNVVHLSGTMINSVGSPSGTFATLPPGVRPTHILYLVLNEGPAPRASLEIAPDGNMTVFGSGNASGVQSLAGLSYQVTS